MSINVSIIICYYNYDKFINDSIDSVFNQSHQQFEIILIDDGSNIPVHKILKKKFLNDKRLKIFSNSINLGLSKSLNKAVRLCSYDYIFNFDSDDIMIKDRIEKQLTYFLNNSEVSILSCLGSYYFNGKIIGLTSSSFYNTEEFKNHFFVRKKLIGILSPGTAFKKEVFTDINFNEELISAMDTDFINHAAKKGYIVNVMKEVLILYRIHENQLTSSKIFTTYLNNEFIKRKIFSNDIISYENFIIEYKSLNIYKKFRLNRKIILKVLSRNILLNFFKEKYIFVFRDIILLTIISPKNLLSNFKKFYK